MGKNRPIVVATLGYIIGIIWGLYFNINIVSFYALISIFLIVANLIKKNKRKRKFKFISIQKIFRYIKLILDFKSLILIIIFSSISNFVMMNLNNKYENLYFGLQDVKIIAKVVDNGIGKEYKTTYKIKVENLNGKKQYEGTYLYLDVNNNLKTNLKYGDHIILEGTYTKSSKATNFQGFDYSQYLRILKIYGTIKLEKVKILKENTNNVLATISNNTFIKIKESVQKNLEEEKANLLLGIIIGYKDEISEEIQEDFKQSNISHILAVSGLHVSYIILAITKVLEKAQGKRRAKISTIFFIIAYMFLTNFTPSVVRAGLMGIIAIVSKLTYNKNDTWTSISISLLIILIYNPYLITSAGVILSYGGTIGIILFQKSVSQICNTVINKIYKYKTNNMIIKIINYIKETISVSFSAQIFIAPIMARLFNTISISFFISNFFVSFIIGPIIIVGFLFIISNFLFSQVLVFKFILEILLELLILISKLGKILPFSKIYIATPEIWKIVIYYVVILLGNIFYQIIRKRYKTTFERRLINWKNLIKHLTKKHHKKVIATMICMVIVFFIVKIIPKDLKIYFIDVGQGDSTLIVTPHNKTILIDGGGSESYDVGKNTLLPYLLDRKITKIDYIIISHADMDHIGGILTILEELKVEKVIVGKQYESSENYEEVLKIVKEKKIFVKQVSKGDKLNIEKDMQIVFLFPDEGLISENSLNNNSLVFKLIYKQFSTLFTGDIEKIAEEKLIEMYGESNVLKSTVLKVAHHGSKTSSIDSFLQKARPQIALIGVGKNNLYGHPNEAVIERLQAINCKIYRTDEMGEIKIKVNNNGKIRNKLIKPWKQ